MIKNILWDFDGVILNSMKIKGDGFLELFGDYDEKYLKEIEKYHYENGGVSRFEKIKYFYSDIINQDISEDDIMMLANQFAEIIENKLYDKSNVIKESIDFIKNHYQNYNFHIVSGAEHYELNKLCRFFEINNYFITIEGSPTKKSLLIKNILKQYSYNKEETILIGDAMTDYNASIKNSIGFYGYNNLKLNNFNYIKSFEEFKF